MACVVLCQQHMHQLGVGLEQHQKYHQFGLKRRSSSSHTNKAESNSLNPLSCTPSLNSSSSNPGSQTPLIQAPIPSLPSSRSSITRAEHG
eukprot:1140893-Pelagomonas_calceolata.AAC.2